MLLIGFILHVTTALILQSVRRFHCSKSTHVMSFAVNCRSNCYCIDSSRSGQTELS